MSKRTLSISVPTGEGEHCVEARLTGGRLRALVDGEQILSTTLRRGLAGVYEDVPIEVGGEPCTLAVRGRELRLAKGGSYLPDGAVHHPPEPVPAWFWLFALLHLGLQLWVVLPAVWSGRLQALDVVAATDSVFALALGYAGTVLCRALCVGGDSFRQTIPPGPARPVCCGMVTLSVCVVWYLAHLAASY